MDSGHTVHRFLSEIYKNKIIFIAEKSPKVAFFAFIM